MLIDYYLPEFDFNEHHVVQVRQQPAVTYNAIFACHFHFPLLLKLIFQLRGLPSSFSKLTDLEQIGFLKLGEDPGKEIVYGIETTSAYFKQCDVFVTSAGFSEFRTDVIKAVINFRVTGLQNTSLITTETRVWCGNTKLKKRFRRYWLFIKPFSGIIRKEILKQMKNQISTE